MWDYPQRLKFTGRNGVVILDNEMEVVGNMFPGCIISRFDHVLYAMCCECEFLQVDI